MNDERIVQLYWDRDESAISATSKKYGAYCYSIAVNILDNWADAEECVNDTYLKTWNAIPPYKPTHLSAFLGKITRNLCFNLYKRAHAEKRGGGQITFVLDELSECISDGNDPEKEFSRQELVKEINLFLASLPQNKRKMFVCRYWYADSISDIAKQFKITENNVSVILNRLRSKLRNYLEERGYGI